MSRPAGIKPVGKSDKLCICIFGVAGVGKTTLAGTSPGKILIVRHPTDHTHVLAPGQADEWVVTDWESINAVQEAAKAGDLDEYDWVWNDTVSLMQDGGLDDIAEQLFLKKPHRKEHGLDKGEYGVNMERLGQWLRVMASAPGFNFGVTAHPMPRDDLGTEILLGPLVQGKNMSGKLCAYMDLVGYYHMVKQKSGDKRVLRTQLTSEYFAKDQLGPAIPNGRLVEPTMPKIMAAIEKQNPHLSSRARAPRKRRRRRATK